MQENGTAEVSFISRSYPHMAIYMPFTDDAEKTFADASTFLKVSFIVVILYRSL